MRLLIVRHGQSQNNEMGDRVAERGLPAEESYQEVLRLHQSDPPLTTLGEHEAEELADFYAPIFTESGRECRVFTSPFFRCCQTAWPLASRLNARVQCHPDVHENGGVHKVSEQPDGQLAFDEALPGDCMSSADIEARFPGYGTALLPAEGQWYVHGAETPAQSAVRARGVAAWLKHDRDLHEDIGGAIMVLVMHGGFINSLLKELLGRDAASEDITLGFPNTATALLDITHDDEPLPSVSVVWIGRVDHLQLGAQAALPAFRAKI